MVSLSFIQILALLHVLHDEMLSLSFCEFPDFLFYLFVLLHHFILFFIETTASAHIVPRIELATPPEHIVPELFTLSTTEVQAIFMSDLIEVRFFLV